MDIVDGRESFSNNFPTKEDVEMDSYYNIEAGTDT